MLFSLILISSSGTTFQGYNMKVYQQWFLARTHMLGRLLKETNEIYVYKYSENEMQIDSKAFPVFNSQIPDYDFLVQDSLEVREFLQSLGFKKLHNSGYDDSSIVAVFHYHGVNQPSVDIQCVKNLEMKLKAQAIIRDCYGSDLPKERSERCKLWNLALRAVEFAVTPV